MKMMTMSLMKKEALVPSSSFYQRSPIRQDDDYNSDSECNILECRHAHGY